MIISYLCYILTELAENESLPQMVTRFRMDLLDHQRERLSRLLGEMSSVNHPSVLLFHSEIALVTMAWISDRYHCQ